MKKKVKTSKLWIVFIYQIINRDTSKYLFYKLFLIYLESVLETAYMDTINELRKHLEKLATFKTELHDWEVTGALARKFIKYKYIESISEEKK